MSFKVVCDEFTENVGRSEVIGYVTDENEIAALIAACFEEDEVESLKACRIGDKFYIRFK